MATKVKDTTKCLYCNELLSEARETCNQCGTAYHDDCWAENQGCAVFGCLSVYAPPEKPIAALARVLAAVVSKKVDEAAADKEEVLVSAQAEKSSLPGTSPVESAQAEASAPAENAHESSKKQPRSKTDTKKHTEPDKNQAKVGNAESAIKPQKSALAGLNWHAIGWGCILLGLVVIALVDASGSQESDGFLAIYIPMAGPAMIFAELLYTIWWLVAKARRSGARRIKQMGTYAIYASAALISILFMDGEPEAGLAWAFLVGIVMLVNFFARAIKYRNTDRNLAKRQVIFGVGTVAVIVVLILGIEMIASNDVVQSTRGSVNTDVSKNESNNDTLLRKAVAEHDLVGTRKLIAAGARVDKLDEQGETLLQVALESDSPKMGMFFLIDRGADINQKNSSGMTLLHNAIEARDKSTVALLMRMGADPLTKNSRGDSSLDMSAEQGDFGLVDILASPPDMYRRLTNVEPTEDPETTPVDNVEDSGASEVIGTTWVGTSGDDSFKIAFKSNGLLEYGRGEGSNYTAKWTKNGDSIELNMNDGYAIYTGGLAGNKIEGTASNIKGGKWDWSVTKK